jgi:hypothetical protein
VDAWLLWLTYVPCFCLNVPCFCLNVPCYRANVPCFCPKAAARRLEEEADKKKAEAEVKHKKVDHQLELAKQRDLVQRATVRVESQKKVRVHRAYGSNLLAL